MTENLDALQDDLDRLEQSLEGAASLTRGFEAELTRMREGLGDTTLDMRVPLTFDSADCDLIASIIADEMATLTG